MLELGQRYWYLLILVIAVCAIWESFQPKRQMLSPTIPRLSANLGLYLLNTGLLALIVPLGALATAWLGVEQSWGLLNNLGLEPTLRLLASLIWLSFADYLTHRAMHAIPALWQLHKIHHSDVDLDISTSVRHHPGETIVGFAIALVWIPLLGIDPFALLLAPVVQRLLSIYQHANIDLPRKLEIFLQRFLMTSELHHLHHSVDLIDGNRNFGTFVPWWDQLFGTFLAEPHSREMPLQFGLIEHRDPKTLSLPNLLKMPLG